jgi:hypothetical protein
MSDPCDDVNCVLPLVVCIFPEEPVITGLTDDGCCDVYDCQIDLCADVDCGGIPPDCISPATIGVTDDGCCDVYDCQIDLCADVDCGGIPPDCISPATIGVTDDGCCDVYVCQVDPSPEPTAYYPPSPEPTAYHPPSPEPTAFVTCNDRESVNDCQAVLLCGFCETDWVANGCEKTCGICR